MSQVLLTTIFRDEQAEILAGWDRTLAQVFVIVGLLDEDGRWRDDVPPVLEAWKEVRNRPTEIDQAASLAAGIQDKLNPLGIQLPNQMLGEIAAHIVLNAGNVVVRYDTDGNRELIEGELGTD